MVGAIFQSLREDLLEVFIPDVSFCFLISRGGVCRLDSRTGGRKVLFLGQGGEPFLNTVLFSLVWYDMSAQVYHFSG